MSNCNRICAPPRCPNGALMIDAASMTERVVGFFSRRPFAPLRCMEYNMHTFLSIVAAHSESYIPDASLHMSNCSSFRSFYKGSISSKASYTLLGLRLLIPSRSICSWCAIGSTNCAMCDSCFVESYLFLHYYKIIFNDQEID